MSISRYIGENYKIYRGDPWYIPKIFHNYIIELHCNFQNVKSIPKTLINLRILNCNHTKIKEIPDTLINLEELYCSYNKIDKIPKTLIHLRVLDCKHTNVKEIPDTLINLEDLYCSLTNVIYIPHTLNKLRSLEIGKILWHNNKLVKEPIMLNGKHEINNYRKVYDIIQSIENILTLYKNIPDDLCITILKSIINKNDFKFLKKYSHVIECKNRKVLNIINKIKNIQI